MADHLLGSRPIAMALQVSRKYWWCVDEVEDEVDGWEELEDGVDGWEELDECDVWCRW